MTLVNLAWFSPMPPARSGIAAYSAEILPRLAALHAVDCFPEPAAHDFVWKQRLRPYDLIVYQLGNSPCHDYMWAYLAAYPGLVVLHDARLHHARARQLLTARRFDDYRRELAYDHPDLGRDVAEYAVHGMGGCLYYLWPMLRVVMEVARTVAVHNFRVADDLRAEYPATAIETIRMGVAPFTTDPAARARVRQRLTLPDDAVVFIAFGKVTEEKRIPLIVDALQTLRHEGTNAWLLVVGDQDSGMTPGGDAIRTTGYVSDEAIGEYLAAADACLCLRWPTALETSASWLRCLAAGRPTVISDLPHLVDVPRSVAMRVDLLNEQRDILEVMRRLAADSAVRVDIGRAGQAYWAANHTLEAMALDYAALLDAAAGRTCAIPDGLPKHFVDDYSAAAREITRRFGLDVDILATGRAGQAGTAGEAG